MREENISCCENVQIFSFYIKKILSRFYFRALFYCMNEAELVEAAVQCLTSGSFEDGASPTHQQVAPFSSFMVLRWTFDYTFYKSIGFYFLISLFYVKRVTISC